MKQYYAEIISAKGTQVTKRYTTSQELLTILAENTSYLTDCDVRFYYIEIKDDGSQCLHCGF